MRLRLVVFGLAAVSVGATACPSQAHLAPLRPCGAKTAVLCGTVVAPLDPSGRYPGKVRLHVEELRAAGLGPGDLPRKTVFLIAGGPGQGSASSFDLVGSGSDSQALFPGYTLVAFDDRGTGRSGPLRCRGIAAALTASAEVTARIVGRCGRELGATRVFYSSRAYANDIENVRRALGLGRIALYGVSYGTTEALAYADAHPAAVQRLVLDSIYPPNLPDPFGLASLRAIPHALASICNGGACRAVTGNPARDFARLANRLAAKPLAGTVPGPEGRPRHIDVDGARLLALANDTDLNPGIAAVLPAAVKAALSGRPAPLERLAVLEDIWSASGFSDINLPSNVATDCADGSFPWPRDAPVGTRPALLRAAVAALTSAETRPFGAWAADSGLADECKDWPAPTGAAGSRVKRLPKVPVLILSGDRDVRTPTSGARFVAAEFPRSRVLVVGGAGHDVLLFSACADRYLVAWLQGHKHGSCPRLPLPLSPLGRYPTNPGTTALSVRRTFALAQDTLRDAEATWLTTQGVLKPLAGLSGGKLVPGRDYFSFTLERYSDVTGLTLSGRIAYDPSYPGHWAGEVAVSGRLARPGELRAREGRLSGALGGRPVSARLAG